MHHLSRAASWIAIVFASGCWAYTVPHRAASARPGDDGVGYEWQMSAVFFGFGVVEEGTLAPGVRARARLAGGPAGDSFWQVEAGGRRLRYCRIGGDRVPACTYVPIARHVRVEMLVILDAGLSRATEDPAADAPLASERRERDGRPAPPTEGSWVAADAVWIASTRALIGSRQPSAITALMRCQVEQGLPVCRAIEENGVAIGADRVLALARLERGLPEPVDTVWLQVGVQLAGFSVVTLGGIARCSASVSAPQPRCEYATVR